MLPDYKNSIVNLMSSIRNALGKKDKKYPYPELALLPSQELKQAKNVVLIVLDGFGYEYLKSKNSLLHENLRGKITSVFPPTTAAAITTFMTGTAPQQHAFTGWFMHLKELGVVATILPFSPRMGGPPFTEHKIKVEEILGLKSLTENLKVSSYVIQHKKICHSSFSRANSKKAKRIQYQTLNGFFRQVKKTINSHQQRKYIYAYWPLFDSLAHKYGMASRKVEQHFWEIEKKLLRLAKSLKKTNTILIVTADHGLIDTSKEKIIRLEDHPQLKECLTMPLCGETRAAYGYVRPSKTKQFESYVRKRWSKYCTLHSSQELIEKKYYGLFKPNPKLADRIGDYALIMKENYILKDGIPGQKRKFHLGNHGGISKEEMLVPLIVFKG